MNNNNYYRGQSFKGSALLSNNTASAYKKLDVNSADYIKYIYNRVKNWCKEVVEINVETGRLQKIVQSDEPYIFIMNHTTTQAEILMPQNSLIPCFTGNIFTTLKLKPVQEVKF